MKLLGAVSKSLEAAPAARPAVVSVIAPLLSIAN
jgi:hypothetical protein